MDLTGKTLLVLGGNAVHLHLVRRARSLGIRTIVTDYLDPVDAPAKREADCHLEIDIKDIAALQAFARTERIDGVLSAWLDPGQEPYVELATRLGLPCYCTKEEVRLFSEKSAFKALCEQHGVDTIPGYSREDVLRGKARYPLFVKPARSRGSRGCMICETQEETLRAIEHARALSETHEAIIERDLEHCDNFMVTLFFVEGEAYIENLTELFTGASPQTASNVTATISPSRHAKLYLARTHEKLVRMLKRIGLRNGPVFFQGFVDGDTIRFYDPGRRFPGADYQTPVRKTTGVDVVRMMLEFALTGRFDASALLANPQSYLLGGQFHTANHPHLKPGKIGTIEGFETLRALPEVLDAYPVRKVGDVITEEGFTSQWLAYIHSLHGSRSEAARNVAHLLRQLDVRDANGTPMLTEYFDTRQWLVEEKSAT